MWLSLVPFVSLILIMLPSVIILGADPQIPLIICIGITAFIGIFVLGYSWSDIENAMIQSVKDKANIVKSVIKIG